MFVRVNVSTLASVCDFSPLPWLKWEMQAILPGPSLLPRPLHTSRKAPVSSRLRSALGRTLRPQSQLYALEARSLIAAV